MFLFVLFFIFSCVQATATTTEYCPLTFSTHASADVSELTCFCQEEPHYSNTVWGVGPFTVNSRICGAATFLDLAPGEVTVKLGGEVGYFHEGWNNGKRTWPAGPHPESMTIEKAEGYTAPDTSNNFNCVSRGSSITNEAQYGEIITQNQCLIDANDNFVGIMQSDGNFVVYDKYGKVYWSTGTGGTNAFGLAVQRDGNLVVTEWGSWRAFWTINSYGDGHQFRKLQMRRDGSLAYYDWWGGVVFQTPTICNSIGNKLDHTAVLDRNGASCLMSKNGIYNARIGSDGNLHVFEVSKSIWQHPRPYPYLNYENQDLQATSKDICGNCDEYSNQGATPRSYVKRFYNMKMKGDRLNYEGNLCTKECTTTAKRNENGDYILDSNYNRIYTTTCSYSCETSDDYIWDNYMGYTDIQTGGGIRRPYGDNFEFWMELDDTGELCIYAMEKTSKVQKKTWCSGYQTNYYSVTETDFTAANKKKKRRRRRRRRRRGY